MCGICGAFSPKERHPDLEAILNEMAASLAHRGPDRSGVWTADENELGLAHRRLSIIDLSNAGAQPMRSASGRYILAFNGEIYNFKELREEINGEGTVWNGHSDTEVMLSAFERWGCDAAVEKFIGMFAFALWDTQEQELYLGRDRIGEKPLYYGWEGDTFLFASELKALKAFPGWQGRVDHQSLSLFVRHIYIPAPRTIYKGFFKLPPGHILKISMNSRSQSKTKPYPYWDARKIVEYGCSSQFRGSIDEALDSLDQLLKKVISGQMISDVPLGAFLSGGIDSSLIVALMQSLHNRPVKTFTVGFTESAYNEANHARRVANHLGTEHTEISVTPEEAMEVIPKLADIYDEPFADASQIPTILVSQITRQYVTVSLSGDAGDELFGGYNRYSWVNSIWTRLSKCPHNLRPLFESVLKALPPQSWDKLFALLTPILPKAANQSLPGDKIHKLAEIVTSKSPEEMYHRLISTWKNPTELVMQADEPYIPITDQHQWAKVDSITEKMMYFDMVTYLPDDILVKVDRAAMASSLETRVPFLDHRVCEFAWKLPLSMKVHDGQGKWLLRRLLYRYVPKELIERPKMGFGVPIDQWLRGPLKEWASDLLNVDRLKRDGYFNPSLIHQKWEAHLSGKQNWQYHLWSVLMFQLWQDRWLK